MGEGGGSGSDSSSELPSKNTMISITIGILVDIMLFICRIVVSSKST